MEGDGIDDDLMIKNVVKCGHLGNDVGILYFQIMENLQLREGSARRSNNNAFRNLSNNTCRSFISTALVSETAVGEEELRKSRIQNLPNYKRSSLGDNINFIVVFQTIEIERLSREVQLLRVKIRENQRELFNAQNYEVQIRELTEKCFHYEQELEKYAQGNEKLNKIVETLYNQNEAIKQRFEEMAFSFEQKEAAYRQKNQELLQEIEREKSSSVLMERSKNKALDEMKLLMESQRKAVVDREMKELSIRHQNQKSAFENEIRKNRELLTTKSAENEELRKKAGKLEAKVNSLQQLRDNVASSQNKISALTAEINRANELIKTRDTQLQAVKKREMILSNKVKEQSQLESDLKYLKGNLQGRMRQLQEAKARVSAYEEDSLRNKEMVHFVNELQDKLNFSSHEVNRLSSVLKSKVDENEKMKGKFMERENELSRLKNLENEMAQGEARMNMMRAENDRVSSILKRRQEEIDNWKKKYNELDAVTTRYSLLERDKKVLEEKYANQLKEGEELKFTIARMETENGELRRFEKSYGEQMNKNNLLLKELERLNAIIRNNVEDMTSSKMRYSKMEESLRNYQDRLEYIHEYENRIKLLTDENDRLNNLISNKNEDIESLESSKIDLVTKVNHYKTYEAKTSEYETTIRKLADNIEGLKRELEGYQGKCRTYQNKLREVENCSNMSQQQKQKLATLNKSKSSQIEEYKNRVRQLEQQLQRKVKLDLVIQELHNQNINQLKEIETSYSRSKEYEEAYNKEKKQNEEFVRKIATMSKEFESMTKELNSRTSSKIKEIDSLEEKVKTHLLKVKEKDQEIERLLGRIDKLEKECEKLTKEFKRLMSFVQANEKQTASLNKKIEQYQDYAKRIHILASELDRLTTLNRGLQEDNKKMRLKYSDDIDFEKRQEGLSLMVVLMSAEIESLRARVDKREINMDEMRKSILEPLKKV